MINIRNQVEIEKLRKSAQIVVKALNAVEPYIQPGVTTEYLDEFLGDFIRSKNARPAFKGFQGFPANTCISVDEQLVHGIPGKRELKEGQIVTIDVGVELSGYYGDAAKTYIVGTISNEKQRLIDVTKDSLMEGIKQARAGNRLYDISHAIQTYVEKHGYAIVRDLVGHGIGTELHEPPQIPNYGEPNKGPRLKKGMVFAIEPMVNMGTWEVKTEPDKWTVVTNDGLPSAHFEHDIVITNGEAEILTLGI